jgi:hypothetical protein
MGKNGERSFNRAPIRRRIDTALQRCAIIATHDTDQLEVPVAKHRPVISNRAEANYLNLYDVPQTDTYHRQTLNGVYRSVTQFFKLMERAIR